MEIERWRLKTDHQQGFGRREGEVGEVEGGEKQGGESPVLSSSFPGARASSGSAEGVSGPPHCAQATLLFFMHLIEEEEQRKS